MKPGTTGFIGTRLVEAREARGLSAIALADCIQVTRQAVSQYENGPATPGPDVLRRICDTLGLPEVFFLRASSRVSPSSPIFFRSLASATKMARLRARRALYWLQDVTAYVFEFVDPPPVAFPMPGAARDSGVLSGDDIECVATDTRRFWKLGDGPISNVLWLLENHGAVIARLHLDANSLDGLSAWIGERPYIVITADKESAARSRFDIAHELGHLLLHRYVEPARFHSAIGFKVSEQQAHRFAAAFLFPQSAFALEAYPLTLERFVQLKRKWKVSVAMMIQRARDLDMISDDQCQRMWRRYTWEQWRGGEPLDQELPVEQPRLLQRSFDMIVREGVQSRSEVLARLAMSGADIEKLACLPHGYMVDEGADVIAIQPRLRSRPTELKPGQIGEVIRFPQTSLQRPSPEPGTAPQVAHVGTSDDE